MTLDGNNARALIGNQKVACFKHSVRIVLVLLTYCNDTNIDFGSNSANNLLWTVS